MNSIEDKLKAFEKLLNVMDDLREKCPWDMKQTNETLRALTIEEVYELGDAILQKDDTEIKKELGDVLLHLVFYAKIGSEKNAFDIADVCNSIVEKLIFRHPHIYGDVKIKDAEEVKQNWEKLKLKEGKKSIFEGVPSGLPSMVKAIRLQEKAKGVGFEWPNSKGALLKLKEEFAELEEAIELNNQQKIEEEMGDLFFSLVNLSRYLKINADNALERTNNKFKNRFEFIENYVAKKNLNLDDLSLEEMDEIWDLAKKVNL